MTCDEFRQTTSSIDPAKMTRGERAIVARHHGECPACRAWLAPHNDGVPDAELDAIRSGDLADPEFREAAGLRR